jgi:hypothetical protein
VILPFYSPDFFSNFASSMVDFIKEKLGNL